MKKKLKEIFKRPLLLVLFLLTIVPIIYLVLIITIFAGPKEARRWMHEATGL